MKRKVPLTVTVDADVLKRFKTVCGKLDIKVSTKINSLMKRWLKENGG